LLFVDCSAKDSFDAVVMDKQDSNGLLLARSPLLIASQVRAKSSAQDLNGIERELNGLEQSKVLRKAHFARQARATLHNNMANGE